MQINKQPSDQSFGFVFSGLLLAFSAYSAYQGEGGLRVYGLLIAAVAVGFCGFFFPVLLNPFKKSWMKLGELMGKVVSPLVLGTIFFVLITPVAIIGRLFGRDELRLKKLSVNSYWVDRLPPGPAGGSFKNQF